MRGWRKALLTAGVVAVLALIVTASVLRNRGEEGVEVDVETVEVRDISRLVKASGEIDPRVKVNISTHVVGRIERLFVEEGDEVRSGEPFLRLEQQAFRAARDDWQARLRRAETDVRQARVSLDDALLRRSRMEELHREGIIPRERLEEAQLAATSAQLALEQAEQAVIQARANLEKAVDDLSKTTLYAPISGRVIELNAEEGEVVVSGTMNNPASVIGTLADLSEILAEVDVDETEIVYVEPDQEARLEVDALPERPYRGKVVEVGSSGYSRRQQQDVTFFKVKILLENPDRALRPGMSVRASINTATHRDVPVVPIQAVVEREPRRAEIEGPAATGPVRVEAEPETDGAFAEPGDATSEIPVVFVLEDGTAVQRPVETGLSDATRVEIVGGLTPGERVVVGPYRRLRELEHGDAIRPADEEGDEEGDANRDADGED